MTPDPHGAGAMTPCPACQSRLRRLFVEHQGMPLYECAACGLVYMDPPPSEATLAALYDDYYDGATQGYFAKVEKKLARSRLRLRRLRALFPPRPAEPLRFLDVGANGGFAVEAARETGFAASGIDLDAASVAYAREHYPANEFFVGSAPAFAATGPDPFDLVYCAEVIEHVPDPDPFVAAIVGMMKPNAVLYLTTPDIGHWRRPRDVTRWDAFAPPGHCLYFTDRALTALFARHGLAIETRRPALKPGLKVVARRVPGA